MIVLRFSRAALRNPANRFEYDISAAIRALKNRRLARGEELKFGYWSLVISYSVSAWI